MAATVEEHAAKLSADFKIKECPAFVHFAGKQSRGAKVLAFNDAEIPLTAEAFNGKKQVNVGFVLVDCLSEGFSRVPYMNTGGALKATNDAKPLTEKSLWPEDPDKQLSQMTCYPYGIIEGHPQEKNQRNEEYKWNLFPGMVLRMMFWAEPVRGAKMDKYREELIAAGYTTIKAFTLLEVELNCKGWSKWEEGDINDDTKRPREICAVKKGYGMGLGDLRPIEGVTLYSVLSKLPKVVPHTLEENKQLQSEYQLKFHSIKDLIQTSSVPFFVSNVNAESCSIDLDMTCLDADEKPLQIKISNWATSSNQENSPIDVSVEDAMRATNTSTIEDACCLLELAASAGALSLLVCYNQYRPGKEHVRSAYYAFPMVDTKVLLRSICVPLDSALLTEDESGKYFAFNATGFKVPCDDEDIEPSGEFSPSLLVSKEPLTKVQGSHDVRSPDFMLAGVGCKMQKGYFVRFVHPKHPSTFVIWSGYVNMAKPQIQMQGASSAAAAAAAAAMNGQGRGKWMKVSSSAPYDPFAVLANDKKRKNASVAEEDEEDGGECDGDEDNAGGGGGAAAASPVAVSNSKREKKDRKEGSSKKDKKQ